MAEEEYNLVVIGGKRVNLSRNKGHSTSLFDCAQAADGQANSTPFVGGAIASIQDANRLG